jgi:hypothetical protein
MRTSALSVLLLLAGASVVGALDASPVADWSFDRVEEGQTRDSVTGVEDAVSGNYRLVEGVKGEAIVLDGYTTLVSRPAELAPKLEGGFTLEAWIALGAYPWNWAPIVAREDTVSLSTHLDAFTWPEDIVVNSPTNGFFFGIGPEGHLGLHVGAGGWRSCRTEEGLPLKAWVHVAATFRPGEGVVLFVDGARAAELEVTADHRPAEGEDLRIGMPRQKLEPSHPVRAFATLASWYSLDGILDELRIYDEPLAAEAIVERYASTRPTAAPDLPPRVMPSGPPGPGAFGASYMHLKYYPEWDALWPVSSDPDVVVQFDDSPVRVVFWRGTRYGPAWVMENGLWMGDQSIENFNDHDGCIEHMLDPQCRFSHVRIIENTPARVVVHWRYYPTAANQSHSQVDPVTGRGDWVDEYYTFYPDQVGVRKVVQHSDGHSLWPEEVIGLCHPGQRPEDVVDLSAMTLVNLDGKSHTYTWAEKTPKVREGDEYLHFGSEPEERPVIIRVNTKSESRPFQIFETTNRFTIFAHEHRKGFSRFPWWNHWPVAQVPSDGRYCQAADRASHFSLAWGGPPPHRGEDRTWWWAWMYGATTGKAESLVPLARSWLRPPELVVEDGSATARYDPTQRSYVLTGSDDIGGGTLRLRLEGDADAPVHNPAIVVEDWGNRGATLEIEGESVPQGEAFRFGHIRRVNRYDLVVWIRREATTPLELSLSPSRQPLP